MNFDIDHYLELVEPLDDGDIDYDVFITHPLDDDTLRPTTIPRSRRFSRCGPSRSTGTARRSPRCSPRHHEPNGRERMAATRRRVGRERLTTLTMMIGSAITEHVVTLALTWGAVNEWTTQAGYVQLAKRSNHPVLGELLRRIARQEGRHIDFYVSQASARLDRSAGARRLTRWALRTRWRPVGSGVMPAPETAYLVAHLFGGDDGASMADRIDRRIAQLPGLRDLGLINAARTVAVAA